MTSEDVLKNAQMLLAELAELEKEARTTVAFGVEAVHADAMDRVRKKIEATPYTV